MNITITTPFNEILVSGDTIDDAFEVDYAYIEDSDIKLNLFSIGQFISFRVEEELSVKVEQYILFLDKLIYDVEFYKGGELFKEQYEADDIKDVNDKIEAGNGGLITITKINIVL